MKTKDQMIHALQTPQRAPFRVTFEIFASTERKNIAKWPKKLAHLKGRDAKRFVFNKNADSEAAERQKATVIEASEDEYLTQPASKLQDSLERHTERYNKIKKYFEEKIIGLGLTNPLIFFDDEALRIDIGYGPKEISALFPDFFDREGVFDTTILGGVNFWDDSPLQFFLNDYIEEDYKNSLSVEKERLLKSASAEFTKPLAPKRKASPEETIGFEEAELIKECFETHRGLIVGEVHEHKSPKQFLVDNMPLFASEGVTTIYMEHLLHERHQPLLDSYLDSEPDAAMPRELELYLNYLDEERHLSGSATFTAVVQAAKKHGIKIIAIDSEAVYHIGVTNSVGDLGNTDAIKERYSAMNMAMLERYRNYYNENQKYIAFIGSGHVSTYLNVPGVSELLSCPNIVVSDLDESTEEYIEQDILFGEESQPIRFDMLYHRHQSTKQPTPSVIRKPSTAKKLVSVLDSAVKQGPEEPIKEELIKKNIENFETNKKEIQDQFIKHLKDLKSALEKGDKNNTSSKIKGEKLYTTLLHNQEKFFRKLTLNLSEKKLKAEISAFRKSCKKNIKHADKIMGHGWLYRIAEVLIKSVVGLFVGIGMVLGSLVGQGLVKSEHRKKFANTFFTLNQTDESQALDKFKQEILGDENEESGLLSDSQLNKVHK